jgi:FAD/FMN-containing dehydrogenases
MSLADWKMLEPKLLSELYAFITGELGGKISGEHGIGLKRKGYLKEVTAPEEYRLFKALKAAFDPLYIMNPGKILD